MEKKILITAIILFIIVTVFFAGCLGLKEEEKRYVVDYKIVDDEIGDETLITKVYQFTYYNKDWHIVASVPKYRYDAYVNEKYLVVKKNRPKSTDPYFYSIEPQEQRAFIIDEYVNDVVEQFKIQNGPLTDEEIINVITYFVQSQIQYEDDGIQYGKEYTAYPMQTLINGKGDCDCVAVLLAGLLNHAGYNSIVVYIPGHMITGVNERAINLKNEGEFIYNNQNKYYLIEATSVKSIGQLDNYNVQLVKKQCYIYDKGEEFAYKDESLEYMRNVFTDEYTI